MCLNTHANDSCLQPRNLLSIYKDREARALVAIGNRVCYQIWDKVMLLNLSSLFPNSQIDIPNRNPFDTPTMTKLP